MIFAKKEFLMNTTMGGDGGAGGGGAGAGGGNPDPNAGGAGGGNPDPNAGGAQTPEWLKGIDADLINDPIMKNHKDIGSVVKSYVHAARMVGADKVVVPGKNASPEEIKAYISKLGLPETPDKYEVKLAEQSIFSGEKSKALKELALKNNILPNQLQSVMDYVTSELDSLVKADETETIQQRQQGIQGLREKWGEEGFKKNAHRSNLTAKHFGGDSFIDYLNQTGLGDDPKLIEVFAMIGSKLKQEDVFQKDITAQYGMSKDEAQKAINALFTDKAYLDKSNPSHGDRLKDMLKYQEILMQK